MISDNYRVNRPAVHRTPLRCGLIGLYLVSRGCTVRMELIPRGLIDL